MTREDMAKAIAEEMGISQVQAGELIQRVFGAITQALLHEGGIGLRGFGVFEVRERKPRKARNPRTGESVSVPAKRVATFRPAQEMQKRVGQLPKVPGGAAAPAPSQDAE